MWSGSVENTRYFEIRDRFVTINRHDGWCKKKKKIKIEKQNKKSWSELSLGRACSTEYSFCKWEDKGSSESAVCPRKLSCPEKSSGDYPRNRKLTQNNGGQIAQIVDCHDLLWSHGSVRKTEGASTGWGLRDSLQTAWKNFKERIMLRNISCKDGLDKGQKWYGPNRSRRY